jgi:AcrR family transcriptional regulator
MPRRTAEAAARTRTDLIAAGRALFAEPGFAATTLEDIVVRAGVTRGGFYHHFASKEALFEAVFMALQDAMTARSTGSAARRRSPLSRFRAGCDAFLDSCLDPEIARIVLLDGPSVLGWETWRRIDEAHGFAVTVAGLAAAIRAGELAPQPVEPLAHLLLGALTHAGMTIGRSAEPQAQRAAVGKAFRRLVDGLAASSAG